MPVIVPLLQVPQVPGAINVTRLDGSEIVEIAIRSPESAQTTTQAIADLAGNPRAVPMAGTSAVITVGGTPVVLVRGPCLGGFILNPPNAASEGIGATENLYVDPVGAPGSTDAQANGTTSIVFPGAQFNFPALSTGVQIQGNAATSGHKLTVVVYASPE